MTLGYHQFEHLLLTHCTPTLIKRKLGSMFHLDNRYSDVHELVEYYDQILNLQGLRINLFFSHGRYTVYVYLPSSLKYLMTNKDIQSFLKQYDYPDHDILSHLEKRLEMSQYPHEIGLFLGYHLLMYGGLYIIRSVNVVAIGRYMKINVKKKVSLNNLTVVKKNSYSFMSRAILCHKSLIRLIISLFLLP